MSKTKELIERIRERRATETRIEGVSTGSTLLNLGCTGNPFIGFVKGHYYLFVGDSSSGKTWISLTTLAEASINPKFDEYRLIYDDAEGGAIMDLPKYFGTRLADRIESPGVDVVGVPVYSTTIEEFYYHVDDAFAQHKPFIYIMDSIDSLSSEPEASKFEQHKVAHRKGKEAAGSYGDGKAKLNSSNLRRLLSRLKRTGSILIIINQTRDNLGFGFEKKTRSGGHALIFYACMSLWASIKSTITKTIQGKKRQLGVQVKIRTKKNRVTGKDRTILLPIYHSHGIDDTGSCIDYLLEENHWKLTGHTIHAPEFEQKCTIQKLIKYIEARPTRVRKLQRLVGRVWHEIEHNCSVSRVNRYRKDTK